MAVPVGQRQSTTARPPKATRRCLSTAKTSSSRRRAGPFQGQDSAATWPRPRPGRSYAGTSPSLFKDSAGQVRRAERLHHAPARHPRLLRPRWRPTGTRSCGRGAAEHRGPRDLQVRRHPQLPGCAGRAEFRPFSPAPKARATSPSTRPRTPCCILMIRHGDQSQPLAAAFVDADGLQECRQPGLCRYAGRQVALPQPGCMACTSATPRTRSWRLST